jgi:hypothetical protein
MRLVNIATDLFAMAATLARANGQRGRAEFKDVEKLAVLFCQEAGMRIQQNFRALWCNPDRATQRAAKSIMDGSLKWIETGR